MIPDNIKHIFNESVLEEEIVEGTVKRHIYTGKNIQVIIYHFPPNKVFPLHSHDKHEQMGFLYKGKMGFRVEDKEYTLNPGDFYHAPIGVEHNAWTLDEPSILIDIFSPVREEYLP